MTQTAKLTQETRQSGHAGFTLIEVVVAVAILGWVLTSAISMVSQYADERGRMRDRFHGGQVAWNQLMEEYRQVRGWQSSMLSSEREESGSAEQAGMEWDWEVNTQAAMGSGLFQYRATSTASGAARPAAVFTLYLDVDGGEP